MQLNKTKSKIRRSLSGGGLNNLCAHSCSPVVSVVEPLVVPKVAFPRFPSETHNKKLFYEKQSHFKTTQNRPQVIAAERFTMFHAQNHKTEQIQTSPIPKKENTRKNRSNHAKNKKRKTNPISRS